MVVLSAAICNKSGKALVARQFVEIPRSRIEGLLAAFPKLIGMGQQHTFIETESVRYVYQPLEELFIVLITNKSSNILEDLETLHVFSRTIPDQCRIVSEEEISKHAFDLIFAFDEIVTSGYRESVTPSQIRAFLEMDSQEERIQEMVARNKEQEAREQQKLRIKQMEASRRDGIQGAFKNPMGSGFGGGSMGGPSGPSPARFSPSPSVDTTDDRPPSYTKPSAPAAKGMKLGKKQTTNDFLEAMKSEEGYSLQETQAPSAKASNAPAKAAPTEDVIVQIEEKIIMVANRDGGLQNLEVKGDLILKVTDPSKSAIKVNVAFDEEKGIQFKTHPNVDKKSWTTENCITLKDPSKPFPVGQPLGVLKWRVQEKDESAIPLSINCWPNPTGDGNVEVNIEYQLEKEDLELFDVLIEIPIPQGSQPAISNVDGEYNFVKSKGVLEWRLQLIDSKYSSGSLEFTCRGNDASQFFPIFASLTSETSYCGVKVKDIRKIDDNSPVSFLQTISFSAEEYSIV